MFLIGFQYVPIWKAALVVVFCGLFEALLNHLDDNVVIPVAAAVMMMMLEI
ncbi:MAG: hypothetical protein K9N05_07005 [Candidatus Marinimicrobia bacterium]|nr:hypothetical protein [Candidatus Neomarinimicrobiota bacterium]